MMEVGEGEIGVVEVMMVVEAMMAVAEDTMVVKV
jgi:hypothetical protein